MQIFSKHEERNLTESQFSPLARFIVILVLDAFIQLLTSQVCSSWHIVPPYLSIYLFYISFLDIN